VLWPDRSDGSWGDAHGLGDLGVAEARVPEHQNDAVAHLEFAERSADIQYVVDVDVRRLRGSATPAATPGLRGGLGAEVVVREVGGDSEQPCLRVAQVVLSPTRSRS